MPDADGPRLPLPSDVAGHRASCSCGWMSDLLATAEEVHPVAQAHAAANHVYRWNWWDPDDGK